MAKGEEGNWLDDAFDESKADEELEHAKNVRRMAYLALAVFVSVFAVCGAACSGMIDVMAAMS